MEFILLLIILIIIIVWIKSVKLEKEIIKELENDNKNLEQELFVAKEKMLSLKEDTLTLKEENSILNKQIDGIESKKAYLEKDIENLKTEKNEIQNELNLLNKELILNSIHFDGFENITSQEIKNQVQLLQIEQDELVKNDKAVLILEKTSDKRSLNPNIKQILRSFNIESKNILDNLTVKNIDASRIKIQKSFNTLNSIYKIDKVAITSAYYEIKLKEITLMYEYLVKLEQEKEQQKAIKEQLVEEEKVRREIEREKTRIDKEEIQFKNEVSKLMKYLSTSQTDAEKQLYIDKIKELEDKLKLLENDKKNVLERETNTRAGYVYIISNIGSFGENIYKIGMTRRLEPMDRIKELSDASVPFQFDVHAMIFSDDAPALENILHQTFKNNQVNKLNPRKEFYNIDLSKIKDIVKNNYNNTVNFTDYAEAYEYRESKKILENIAN